MIIRHARSIAAALSAARSRAAEFHRVLARLLRQLVDEAFDRKDIGVGPDAAPKAGRHPGRFVPHQSGGRVGRTGRASRSGVASTFASPEEKGDLRKIERALRINMQRFRVKDTLPIAV